MDPIEINDRTEAYLAARAAAEAAKARLAEASAALLDLLGTGEYVETTDGVRIRRIDPVERIFDATVAEDVLPEAVYVSILAEPKVKADRFDAAVKLGLIGEPEVAKIVTEKPKAAYLKVDQVAA